MNNIDKKEFNKHFIEHFTHYVTLEGTTRERYFNKYIYHNITSIINNVLFYIKFDEEFTREDTTADLLHHFIKKEHKIVSFNKDVYNALFTVFRNRLLDLIRTHKRKQNRLDTLLQIRNENTHLLKEEIEEIDLDKADE